MKTRLGATIMLMVAGVLSGLVSFPSIGTAADENQQEIQLEPIVVTATRTQERIEEIASSVTVINAEEIEAANNIMLKETLRRVPGLDITSQGGLGRFSSVFIRGARSEDTLVMIDGMEINDPISPDRAFNFSDLTTLNIERVEVVRGPQSTLYGSDAIGGVINIITKKGSGPPRFSLLGEGGSDATFREVFGGSGSFGKWDYSLSGSRLDSDGIGSDDDYEDNAFSGRIGYAFSDRGSLDLVFRSRDAKVHLDDWDFYNYQTTNDPNYVEETNSQMYQFRYRQRIIEPWETALKIAYYEINRDDKDNPDLREPDHFEKGWYDASIFNVDWQNNISISSVDTITVGIEYEEEEGESYYYYRDAGFESVSLFPEKSAYTYGYFIQNQLALWDSLYTTVGVRIDDHEEFGSEITYKGAIAYLHRPTGTKIKGTWGTGFKAPTLYQLHAPAIPDYFFLGGNPDLDPEESESFDIGVEQTLFDDKLTVNIVYFNNDYDDFIAYFSDPVTFTSTYVNLDEAEAEGWEIELRLIPFESLSISANYTYTDTEDKTNGGDLLRRPEDKYSLVVDYDYKHKLHANLGIYYVGDRIDWRTFTGDEIKGESYTRVDLALRYTVSEQLQLYTRIENLFDEKYQELRGYDAAGFSAFGGFKLSF
ncbi:MAG: TonB-dependent receptor [Deltaproteobacteria bacterium]|nr:TonB-dependent receptor [Deltaproteobacteria bacterium]